MSKLKNQTNCSQTKNTFFSPKIISAPIWQQSLTTKTGRSLQEISSHHLCKKELFQTGVSHPHPSLSARSFKPYRLIVSIFYPIYRQKNSDNCCLHTFFKWINKKNIDELKKLLTKFTKIRSFGDKKQ